VDGKGQPLTADGVALSDGDYMEELRRHPVYSSLFQQRSGLYSADVPESGPKHGGTENLQTLSTAEIYLEAVKGTTPHTPGGCASALITPPGERDGLVSGVGYVTKSDRRGGACGLTPHHCG
jgi:hypothetical protein